MEMMMMKLQLCSPPPLPLPLPRLPEEIIITILAMLPVKSIYRFRSVSKIWCSLFSSPYFVKLHSNHAIEQDKFMLIITHSNRLYTIDYNSLASNLSIPIDDYSSFIPLLPNFMFLGSCNGLVSFIGINIYLWNPSTDELKSLPETPYFNENKDEKFKCIETTKGWFGFGYDSKLHDYKILYIVRQAADDFSYVMLYSLRSNSWKSMDNIPYKIIGVQHGVLINGALYWKTKAPFVDRWWSTSTTTTYNAILCFDIVGETFTEVPIPKHYSEKFSDRRIQIGGLGDDCLCIFDTTSKLQTEVWVMKKKHGGVTEEESCWTRFFIITEHNVIPSSSSLNPIKCFKNGNVILEKDYEHIILYDPKQKKDPVHKLTVISDRFEAVTCVSSLVPLNSGIYLKQQVDDVIQPKLESSSRRRRRRRRNLPR